MLFVDPSYAGGHYFAAIIAEHKGDSLTARNEFTAAEKLWEQADPDLSEIVDLRGKLVVLRSLNKKSPP